MASRFLETGFDCVERVEGAVDGEAGDGTGLRARDQLLEPAEGSFRVRISTYDQRSGPQRDQWLCFGLLSHGGMGVLESVVVRASHCKSLAFQSHMQ